MRVLRLDHRGDVELKCRADIGVRAGAGERREQSRSHITLTFPLALAAGVTARGATVLSGVRLQLEIQDVEDGESSLITP